MFRLYREPESNETTVIAVDPSEGGDYCTAVAKSKKHADSFMVYQAKIESSQLGYEVEHMAKYIRHRTNVWPTIGVERNTGQATIFVLQQLNYPNLFRMQSFDKPGEPNQERIGWVTSVSTRPKMLDDLALSIRQRANIIYDKETIKEMMTFIRKQRTGKPEAEEGCYDDLVIAEAIAWQLYQLVPTQAEVNFPPMDYDEVTGVPL